jgi:hypothetical protein
LTVAPSIEQDDIRGGAKAGTADHAKYADSKMAVNGDSTGAVIRTGVSGFRSQVSAFVFRLSAFQLFSFSAFVFQLFSFCV